MTALLKKFKIELETELNNILTYWMAYGTDKTYGGFVGKLDNCNQADEYADKGSVLNSRILWTFSAAYPITKNSVHLQHAERAYRYFADHFIDAHYGGVFWTLNYKGQPADRKKQVYAQAFAIYALSEYFRATGIAAARQHAIDLFLAIEKFSYDKLNGGYIDAFAENWTELQDIRLSEKDANEKKTMNTHLHILEAYTNLYRIWPETILKTKINKLLRNFMDHIINGETGHLILFFDEYWNTRSNTVSYGHDIEAAWLLEEAAAVINDQVLLQNTRRLAIQMADAACEGLAEDGGLWYEFEPDQQVLIKEKHWWPQAEAMIGFFNAWQLSGSTAYLQRSHNSWQFVQQHILDQQHGEWFWGVMADYAVMQGQDKVGIWKCPYHNSRACMEIIKRIGKLNPSHV